MILSKGFKTKKWFVEFTIDQWIEGKNFCFAILPSLCFGKDEAQGGGNEYYIEFVFIFWDFRIIVTKRRIR